MAVIKLHGAWNNGSVFIIWALFQKSKETEDPQEEVEVCIEQNDIEIHTGKFSSKDTIKDIIKLYPNPR